MVLSHIAARVFRLRARNGGHRDALAPSAAHRRRGCDAQPFVRRAIADRARTRHGAPGIPDFGVSLFEAKERFEEIREIIRLALRGKPSPTTARLQDRARDDAEADAAHENVHSSVPSASPRARQDRRSRSRADDDRTGAPRGTARNSEGLGRRDAGARRQYQGLKVVSPILVIAETDREAMEQARRYIPRWFELQVEHTTADEKLYGNVPSYASFSASSHSASRTATRTISGDCSRSR